MVHGILLINKTTGGTSHSIVNSLRRIIGQKAVGHAGTLDPLAEGLMVILLGYGTKLSNYLLTQNKRYHFFFRLGVQTNSLDKTGTIISTKKVDVDSAQITKIIKQHEGELCLPVPLFSAVKIKGKKLYEYERDNKPVELPNKDMRFYDLDIKSIKKDLVEVEVSCSKGSYIRSWVSSVGDKLGTGACLEGLTRLESSPFHVDSSVKVQDIKTKLESCTQIDNSLLLKNFKSCFIPFSQALPHIKGVEILNHDKKQLKQGQIPINLKKSLLEEQKIVNKNKTTQTIKVMTYENKNMLALIELQPFLSPKFLRVFSELS